MYFDSALQDLGLTELNFVDVMFDEFDNRYDGARFYKRENEVPSWFTGETIIDSSFHKALNYGKIRTNGAASTWWVETDGHDNNLCFNFDLDIYFTLDSALLGFLSGCDSKWRGISVSVCAAPEVRSDGTLGVSMTEPIIAYDQPGGLALVCQSIMEKAASAIGARMDHAQLEDDVQSQIDAFVNDRLVVGPDIVARPCSHVSQCGNMFQQGDLGVSVATALQPFVRTLLSTQFGDLERTCTVPPGSSGSQKFCHMRIPISRVEALPSGIEFILAEHEHEPIPSVFKLNASHLSFLFAESGGFCGRPGFLL